MNLETYDRLDDRKKTRRKNIIIAVIVLILIILLICFFIRMSGCSKDKGVVESGDEVEFEEEQVVVDEGEPIEEVEKTCITREFEWSIAAGGWDNLEEPYISPYYSIKNEDQRTGIFRLRYTFFDETVFPYVVFGQSDFTEIADEAAMHSEWRTFTLEPNEEAIISIPTRKPEIGKNYWAVPDIEVPPDYEVCE